MLLLASLLSLFDSARAEPAPPAQIAAKELLAEAVQSAGLRAPRGLEVRFSFRGTPYQLWLDGQRAIYRRQVTLPNGTVRTDRLEGDRFTSSVGGEPVELKPADAAALRRSLNSVAYFALLPRPLEDEAVIARSLGSTRLEGQDWDTVEIRFREEGGGEDHDDVFRYWIHPETHRLGYLAYTFETGEGGVRLRKATRYHEVDGVVLVDWANHGRPGHGITLDQAVEDFEAGRLPPLSTIALEDLAVSRGVRQP